MDFMAQLQAHMMSHQYEGMMKKANLRGYGWREESRIEYESQSIGQENVPELQDHPAQGRRAGDLHVDARHKQRQG